MYMIPILHILTDLQKEKHLWLKQFFPLSLISLCQDFCGSQQHLIDWVIPGFSLASNDNLQEKKWWKGHTLEQMWWVTLWVFWQIAVYTRDLCSQIIVAKPISLFLQKNSLGPRFPFMWVLTSSPWSVWCHTSFFSSMGCITSSFWFVWCHPNKNSPCHWQTFSTSCKGTL